MARAKPADTPKPAPRYVFPGFEDDPTLGGAIPARLYERLHGTAPAAPADESADDASDS